ncbi:glutathione S-transferase [Wenzhouxiangella sp. XN79A]|uniref:glutathione S-transferase family protein n=1 Tax=Wenzhouxiangella sp. XN79A TaxID=2724193 RepID=UPI00144ADFDE|nr:glutathione S-transferase N-terminal domain-containing protein [Wenzhouxiangella sp. XN79A]NKI35434.1 glutathione S-transferase [Wenzhouxiangella sp. XN79A]
MELFTDPRAPSPRRVHLFLRVRAIELPLRRVDLAGGEHLSDAYRDLNPAGTVPALVLDDGTVLTEVMAICRYLDERADGPPLYGNTPLERARILDREHWVEMQGLLAVMDGFRNASPGLRDRALPGPAPVVQLPELAERGRQRFERFLDELDLRLTASPGLAGEQLTPADIAAFVVLEFARWGTGQAPGHAHKAIRSWQARMIDWLEPADA